VELVIPLPLARRQSVESVIAIFAADKEIRLSAAILHGEAGDSYIASDGKVRFTLPQSLTTCRVLRVQLECYDAQGTIIERTPISERILFSGALADDIGDLPEAGAEPNVIAQLVAQMHSHGNKLVLDELGDDLHRLTYKGSLVPPEPLTNEEIQDILSAIQSQL
jgi:hypothetical protein